MIEDWTGLAACAGESTEIFYDENRYLKARSICRGCYVKDECLKWALESGEEFGVWGGKSPRERAVMQRAAHETVEGMESHGTEADYQKHLRINTVPCAKCRQAHARYTADVRRRKKIAVGC